MARQSQILLLITCLLVLCAGFVLGRLSVRPPGAASVSVGHVHWADQLNLTSQQRQQMDAIWAEAHQKLGKVSERRHALDDERDNASRAMLNDLQVPQYDQILDEFRAKRQDFSKERTAILRDAEDRSRALLSNDSQRKQWDAWMKEREAQRTRTATQRSNQSATQPATQETNKQRP